MSNPLLEHSVMAVPIRKQHAYHTHGDVHLVSNDGVEFTVDSWRLARASEFFRELFEIPLPSRSDQTAGFGGSKSPTYAPHFPAYYRNSPLHDASAVTHTSNGPYCGRSPSPYHPVSPPYVPNSPTWTPLSPGYQGYVGPYSRSPSTYHPPPLEERGGRTPQGLGLRPSNDQPTKSIAVRDTQVIPPDITRDLLDHFINICNTSHYLIDPNITISIAQDLFKRCDQYLCIPEISNATRQMLYIKSTSRPWTLLVFASQQDDLPMAREALSYMSREDFCDNISAPYDSVGQEIEAVPFWTRMKLLQPHWQSSIMARVLSEPRPSTYERPTVSPSDVSDDDQDGKRALDVKTWPIDWEIWYP